LHQKRSNHGATSPDNPLTVGSINQSIWSVQYGLARISHPLYCRSEPSRILANPIADNSCTTRSSPSSRGHAVGAPSPVPPPSRHPRGRRAAMPQSRPCCAAVARPAHMASRLRPASQAMPGLGIARAQSSLTAGRPAAVAFRGQDRHHWSLLVLGIQTALFMAEGLQVP